MRDLREIQGAIPRADFGISDERRLTGAAKVLVRAFDEMLRDVPADFLRRFAFRPGAEVCVGAVVGSGASATREHEEQSGGDYRDKFRSIHFHTSIRQCSLLDNQ